MLETTMTRYDTEEARWAAMERRDAAAEGAFWIAVQTTGIYCRPGCPARMPKRENVSFFDTRDAARMAGFRACKRCKPDEPALAERQAKAVAAAVKLIEAAAAAVKLDDLALRVGVSPHHLHRLFKSQLGVTPKQYADALRAGRLRDILAAGGRVTDAVYDAGFGAPSRMYDQAGARLGMAPSEIKRQGENMEIRYTIADSWLGRALVAATEKGICCIQFDDDDQMLTDELQQRFPNATLAEAEAGSDYAGWVQQTLAFIEEPATAPSMPLDIRGTAFQEQVWRALMTIRAGETKTYSEVAKAIGKPKAVRAVASACGANKIAVIIPCHRVIGKDGSVTGYRWGTERKQKLLARESA